MGSFKLLLTYILSTLNARNNYSNCDNASRCTSLSSCDMSLLAAARGLKADDNCRAFAEKEKQLRSVLQAHNRRERRY